MPHPRHRDDDGRRAAGAAFAALDPHAPIFPGVAIPPPDPGGFAVASLGTVHPASWPWHRALAPDFFAWLRSSPRLL